VDLVLPCAVAFVASALTLFTGFGLGTLLLPALAVSMDTVEAVATTALVHLLNNLFKLLLVGRHARAGIVARFGLPAMAAAFAGALALTALGKGEPLRGPPVLGLPVDPRPADLVVGIAILFLAVRELFPRGDAGASPSPTAAQTVLAGLASGFVGGLTGHQGAVRSAYLLRLGLSRDAFVGTNVAIACLVDLSRLAIYGTAAHALAPAALQSWGPPSLCAFAGALLGARLVRRSSLLAIRRLVGAALAGLGLAIAAGWL
jgi:hypothetical protein